ncbi:ABC transporter permease [Ulvibacterium marinum]|uniref:ABC transporter permease n=1 Tax=Ulvibacterium marinum TaxID=2419782 RepID=A0A3B0CG50_9FLAO|nr:ABC transporter permease [Ulvibacterium marinum]RKN82897.1 ABC transporter permease [Ulvibacterium marinum]
MFKNHIKIALRFFKKNKLFTTINVLGLTIGITAFLLITQYVSFEKNYDKFQHGIENVYRVTLSTNFDSDAFSTSATNHPALGPAMKTDFPEVESYARMVDRKVLGGSAILSYKTDSGELIKSNINDFDLYFAEGALLKLFDIPLVSGSRDTALEEPQTIILSESTAHRFFGVEEPLGKELSINSDGSKVRVTGVFKDLPQNTHLKFDMLASFTSLDQEYYNTTWVWPEFYNYVKLKSGTDSKIITEKFPAFVQKYLSDIMDQYGFQAKFDLQSASDIHLKSKLSKEMSANSSEGTLTFLMIVAAFVIVIALINFINLSTAKSMERAREVGLKKVVGAKQGILISQFLWESLLINLVAVLLAIFLTSLLMEPFNKLVGLDVLSLATWWKPGVWLVIFAILVVGGLLAGLYPAFVLSSFNPIQVLTGKFHRSGKGTSLRKALVVTQFTLSIALISGTFIVYNQFSFMQNQELGFKADQNLVVNAPMDVADSIALQKIRVFKGEMERNPKVNSVTLTNEVPGKPFIMTTTVRKSGDEAIDGSTGSVMEIDEDFLTAYDVDLVAGRNLVKEDKGDYYVRDNSNIDPNLYRVLINRASSKALGFTTPEAAIHQKIVFKYGPIERTAEIMGVVENYHQRSLESDYDKILFIYPTFYYGEYLTVNMSGKHVTATVADVERQFNALFPKDPFDYFFLDQYFNRQYQADIKFGTICLLFSILAIFIAALGLFGLGSHMAMQKTKEISVRKVLGASVGQALAIIPKKLLGLVMLSSVIAFPIIYFITKKWLENYAFKIEVGLWMFLAPLFIVMVVAALSILAQSLKTALVNPAESLRNE